MKIVKFVIACASVMFIAQGAFAQEGTKIGVINPLQALFNSDAAKVVQEEIQQEFSEDEARAVVLSDQLTKLRDDYQANSAVMTQDQIRRMNSSAQDLQVQLQLINERAQKALQERNQQFLESMQQDLARAVTEIVAEGGFDLILNSDSTPYFAPVLDITARVTAKINEIAQKAATTN